MIKQLNYIFNFNNQVTDQVQPHKRFPQRLAWIYLLNSGLKSIYNEFKQFVDDIRFDLSIDGSTLSIEYMLDVKTGVPGHIIIPAIRLQRVYIYYPQEGAEPVYSGYLYTQQELSSDANFIVQTPTQGQNDYIGALVERYKFAGLSFTIENI
jgi:hypothetical protein